MNDLNVPIPPPAVDVGGNDFADPACAAVELPDGSGCFTGSLPLPKDHWLYTTVSDGDPEPILSHDLRDELQSRVRLAVCAATFNGKENDFDPDALVQNVLFNLCGPLPVQVHSREDA